MSGMREAVGVLSRAGMDNKTGTGWKEETSS